MSDRERFDFLLAQPALSLAEVPEFLALIDKLDYDSQGSFLLVDAGRTLAAQRALHEASKLDQTL